MCHTAPSDRAVVVKNELVVYADDTRANAGGDLTLQLLRACGVLSHTVLFNTCWWGVQILRNVPLYFTWAAAFCVFLLFLWILHCLSLPSFFLYLYTTSLSLSLSRLFPLIFFSFYFFLLLFCFKVSQCSTASTSSKLTFSPFKATAWV